LNAELAVKLRKRHVQIPSLSQRGPDDLLLLCEDLLQRICARQRLNSPLKLDQRVASILTTSEWPENISDLVRVLEYAIRQCRGNTIRVAHLPKDMLGNRPQRAAGTLDEIVADAQRTAIENALDRTGGDVAAAAKLLGRNPKGLYRLMGQLGISTGERRRN
jgi:sigma-54 dependent transcriptional regulator, acetoin dehydrogenase operon transcriptional activator AcoR